MTTDRFHHIFIQPSSYEASLRFYGETLGWAMQFCWGGDGEPRGACLGSGSMTVVIAEPHAAADDAGLHGVNGTRPTVHLHVDDIHARHAALRSAGCALFPPQPTHWGTVWFVARDPDGNLIAFEQAQAG